MQETWHARSVAEALAELSVEGATGLSAEEARERRSKYGENTLAQGRRASWLTQLFDQLKSPLAFILLIAGFATLLLHEYLNALVIVLALAVNVVIGMLQEGRASRAFEALASSQERFATLLRSGKRTVVPSSEVAPGDIVLLEMGGQVPADVRLIESKDLSLNEAALTGEWVPTEKSVEAVAAAAPLTERTCMAYAGTFVVAGFGTGVAVATGARTELGVIASSLSSVSARPTPLQETIRKVARLVLVIVAVAAAVIVVLGLWRGEELTLVILTAIAVAVAAVPEGLPAAITVVLALGMERILKQGGLVRNLLAAETLGSTTIVLTDKTGTLTQARMEVGGFHTPAALRGEASEEDDRALLAAAIRTTHAFVEDVSNGTEKVVVRGRPVERALVHAGLLAGITEEELAHQAPRVDFLTFDSARRFSASLVGSHEKNLFVAGSPELMLASSTAFLLHGDSRTFTDTEKRRFEEDLARLTEGGSRVIAVASRTANGTRIDARSDGLLSHMTFMGFIALHDPLREDAAESVRRVQEAGVRVVMLTGDNANTARAVAAAAGIAAEDATVLEGVQLHELSDDALVAAVHATSVFARVTPSDKLRIARVLTSAGEVVAMTGDGVNDAPALEAANIGVAIGSGTEVAKEASDLVLVNDSFSIITKAIEEGRRVRNNFKKIFSLLLSTSVSNLALIVSTLVVGAPLPVLPAQILWTNIIEGGLMNFALAFEKGEPQSMRRSPRDPEIREIVSKNVTALIFLAGSLTAILLSGLYFLLLAGGLAIEEIRTIMFIALTLDTLVFAFALKSFTEPFWRINPLNNPLLLIALLVSVVLLAATLLVPPLSALLSLVPLGIEAYVLLALFGLLNLFGIEIGKHVFFARARAAA